MDKVTIELASDCKDKSLIMLDCLAQILDKFASELSPEELEGCSMWVNGKIGSKICELRNNQYQESNGLIGAGPAHGRTAR